MCAYLVFMHLISVPLTTKGRCLVMWFRKPRGLQPHAWALTRLLRTVPRSLAKYKIFKVTVVNREVIPRKGRVIVACNHLSVSDPVYLWGAMRRNATAIAMAELWRIPLVNLVMWLLGQIPVKRGNADSGKRASAAGKRILEHDGLLFIFPEGKCSKTGKLLEFRRGVVVLSIETGSPIVPAGIIGSNLVKPLGSWRVRRRHHVRLAFDDLMYPGDYAGPNQEEDMLAELRRRILALTAVPE
jgi:1-acyl-sn-glycerol-3-phosphate acyltransferase